MPMLTPIFHRLTLSKSCLLLVAAFWSSLLGGTLGAQDEGLDFETLWARVDEVHQAVQAEHPFPMSRAKLLEPAVRRLGADHPNVKDYLQATQGIVTDEVLRAELEKLDAALADDLDAEVHAHWRLELIRGLGGLEAASFSVLPANEVQVAQQLEQNRYVGIGIRIRNTDGVPQVDGLLYGGPAEKGGLQVGDRFIEIDGFQTKYLGLGEVVQALRGPLNSELEVIVQQPAGPERKIKMTRSEVPIATIEAHERIDQEHWKVALPEAPQVAYLDVVRIAGSTVAELRSLLRQARSADCELVVLDFRRCSDASAHQATLLADLLLADAPIGTRQIKRQSEPVRSNADAEWIDRPMLILVGKKVPSEVAWALQAIAQRDNVTLLGEEGSYQALIRRDVPLADGSLIQGMPIGFLLPIAAENESISESVAANQMPDPFKLPVAGTIPNRQPNAAEFPAADEPGRQAAVAWSVQHLKK